LEITQIAHSASWVHTSRILEAHTHPDVLGMSCAVCVIAGCFAGVAGRVVGALLWVWVVVVNPCMYFTAGPRSVRLNAFVVVVAAGLAVVAVVGFVTVTSGVAAGASVARITPPERVAAATMVVNILLTMNGSLIGQ
jgi:hypothetical protein